MKKTIAVFAVALGVFMSMTAVSASRKHHRVVLDASSGEESWNGILTNVENLQKAFTGEPLTIEVVAHGKALPLLLKNGREAERVTKLAQGGVIFAACENAMRNQKVTREELNPKATTVPSGVAEIVKKQEAGWSYIKPGA